MIDLHSHLIPNIDDGSKSLEESIEIIRKASFNGVTDLVVTPHFILGSIYNVDNEKKKELFEQLKKKIFEEKIKVNLYLGNEVFIEPNMIELLQKNQIMTLNNSRYLLFELPINNEYKNVKEIVFQLKVNGCEPILAHPERYLSFQKNPNVLFELYEQGVFFQCNIGSFYGEYGKEAKKLFLLLLKHHMIHFISTDTHHEKDIFYDKIEKIKENLEKYISKEEIEELFYKNAKQVILDQKLEKKEVRPFQKNFLGKWK